MPVLFKLGGSTKQTDSFLASMRAGRHVSGLDGLAQRGVSALSAATPVDSGATAAQWGYEIVTKGDSTTIWWRNTNEVNGFNIAIGLQYGHGTGTGGWVSGRDYINPALRPIFDEIADAVWEKVTSA